MKKIEAMISSNEMAMLILRQRRKSMLLWGLKISMRLHRECFQLAMAVDRRGDRVRHRHRSEQRGEDADEERDAEALDRAGTQRHQSQRGEQVRDVGVQDRGPRFFVTRPD